MSGRTGATKSCSSPVRASELEEDFAGLAREEEVEHLLGVVEREGVDHDLGEGDARLAG